MRPGHAGALVQCPGSGLLLLRLLGVLGGTASEPHSLRYFVTGVSDPSPGVPQFMITGYVDGHLIDRYDSETQRDEPGADWIAANTDQQYWDRETEISQSNEKFFRVNLDTLQERYNQSRGSHTWQRMYGCDLLEDGSIRGFDQYGYEGRDFIALDKDVLTFTAVDTAAQITKRKWEQEGTVAEQMKYYLENTCIEWLRKYVSYGKDVLERRERPEVRVSGMEAYKILTLSCRAHGFYPRPISISWLKDGMVQEQETKRGSTVPNSDGTYHAWATIDVLPGDWDKYQCCVEHASLPQPGLFSWEPQSNLIPIVVGVAVAVVVVIAALAGFAVWKSKQGNVPGQGRRRRATMWHQVVTGKQQLDHREQPQCLTTLLQPVRDQKAPCALCAAAGYGPVPSTSRISNQLPQEQSQSTIGYAHLQTEETAQLFADLPQSVPGVSPGVAGGSGQARCSYPGLVGQGCPEKLHGEVGVASMEAGSCMQKELSTLILRVSTAGASSLW